jgi:hypothetical protein
MNDATGGHPLEQLSSYLDDELASDDRAAIDRHLALCADCREHLDALRLLSGAIAAEAVPALPGDLEVKVLRRIDAATVVPLRRRRFVVPASVAATIAAVGLVAVVAWKRPGVESVPRLDRDTGATSAQQVREKSAAVEQPLPTAPAPPPAGEIAKFKRDEVVDKAMARSAPIEPHDEGAPGGVAGGVLGGVAREVEDHMEVDSAKSKDERLADTTVLAPGGLSPPAASVASARRNEANTPFASCADPVDDLSVEAVWDVADPVAAARELQALAAVHGGRLELPGAASPATFAIVVPRERSVAFAAAARTLGVAGLDDAAMVAGPGCIRQRIVLRTRGTR